MPKHGSKTVINGTEKIYHQEYGWMTKKDFFEMPPIHGLEDHHEVDFEPDTLSRQSGESFDQYHDRLKRTEQSSTEEE